MREIRTFELEHGEPAVAWRIARPGVLTVTEGQVWLTLEGDAEDYWLAPGAPFALPQGARVWVSAGRDGARFSLAFASTGAGVPARAAAAVRGRIPRWLQVA
jgi:quercetin dioxygenase-like cupin family protein